MKTMRFVRCAGLVFVAPVLAVVFICTGCGTTNSPAQPQDVRALSTKMELDTGDVVTVEVYGEKELSGKFQVSEQGTIDYPLVGRIRVLGMAPPVLADTLRTKLAEGYLKNPNVNVFVEGYNNKKRIVVWGQVQKAGTFNYVNDMSIIEAITLAGGLTPLARKSAVTVTRVEADGKSKTYTVNVNDGSAGNYRLKAGDIIFVPESIL